MANHPVIGDFRSKPDNKPRESTESTPAAGTAGTPPPSVVETYLKQLKEHDIDVDLARVIYDDVLTQGYYEEVIPLRKGTRAVFRTRQYDDTLRIQTEFELSRPQLQITQDDLITRYNLAASLYEWKGNPIKHDTDEDFDAALALVKKLPGPVYSLLAAALGKFDQKVMIVFSPGATENFT